MFAIKKDCTFGTKSFILYIIRVSGELWFRAKDIAEVLEYVNPQQAVRKHITADCKKTLADLRVMWARESTGPAQEESSQGANEISTSSRDSDESLIASRNATTSQIQSRDTPSTNRSKKHLVNLPDIDHSNTHNLSIQGENGQSTNSGNINTRDMIPTLDSVDVSSWSSATVFTTETGLFKIALAAKTTIAREFHNLLAYEILPNLRHRNEIKLAQVNQQLTVECENLRETIGMLEEQNTSIRREAVYSDSVARIMYNRANTAVQTYNTLLESSIIQPTMDSQSMPGKEELVVLFKDLNTGEYNVSRVQVNTFKKMSYYKKVSIEQPLIDALIDDDDVVVVSCLVKVGKRSPASRMLIRTPIKTTNAIKLWNEVRRDRAFFYGVEFASRNRTYTRFRILNSDELREKYDADDTDAKDEMFGSWLECSALSCHSYIDLWQKIMDCSCKSRPKPLPSLRMITPSEIEASLAEKHDDDPDIDEYSTIRREITASLANHHPLLALTNS